jgi:hypothetical protein
MEDASPNAVVYEPYWADEPQNAALVEALTGRFEITAPNWLTARIELNAAILAAQGADADDSAGLPGWRGCLGAPLSGKGTPP